MHHRGVRCRLKLLACGKPGGMLTRRAVDAPLESRTGTSKSDLQGEAGRQRRSGAAVLGMQGCAAACSPSLPTCLC